LHLLLKPIVSQSVVKPQESIEPDLHSPSIDVVDETIVLCLG
jgi:hypothetical protein